MDNLHLWWTNEYGKANLYTVEVDTGIYGKITQKIGLRTLTVSTKEDK